MPALTPIIDKFLRRTGLTDAEKQTLRDDLGASYVTPAHYAQLAGLDAALDGKLSKAGDTMTGLLISRGTVGAIGESTQGTPGFEVTGGGGGNAAYMTFHRPGVQGVRFGLDSDNQLKVGGWSYGSSAHTLWHEGNFSPYSLNPNGIYFSSYGSVGGSFSLYSNVNFGSGAGLSGSVYTNGLWMWNSSMYINGGFLGIWGASTEFSSGGSLNVSVNTTLAGPIRFFGASSYVYSAMSVAYANSGYVDSWRFNYLVDALAAYGLISPYWTS